MPNYDPTIETSIIHAMGIDPNHLKVASVYGKVKSIVSHFESMPNPRAEVLKILARKPGNALDIVWTYVQLQKEKQAALNKLDPEDFEPDVANEIVAGHMTIRKKERVREDINKQKALIEKQKLQQAQIETNQKKTELINTLSEEKLDLYGQVLRDIDNYDKELSFYG